MSFGLALLTGLWYWFFYLLPGYTLQTVFGQPIVMALPIGLILGDVPTAMKIGAAIETVYMGMIAPGANIPADECLAGLIAIPIALKAGIDPETAVTLAIPFGILGVFLDQLRRTINVHFGHKADQYALEGNTKGIGRCAILYPMLVGILLRFPPVFVANLYGPGLVEALIESIPEWILHGVSIAGGLLPALGFAITIFVIGKRNLIPFFIIGFFLVKYLELNIMAAAIFGTCIALLVVLMKNDERGESI